MLLTFPMMLAVLQAFPVCWADRGDPRKPKQLETMARAIFDVSGGSVDKAAKLATLFRWEGAGCLAVHSGEHPGKGRGPFQLEGQEVRYSGPFAGLSYEATLNAAKVASDYLDRSYQCGPSPRAVFTAYAGRPCGSDWKTLNDRVKTYRWVTWRLSR